MEDKDREKEREMKISSSLLETASQLFPEEKKLLELLTNGPLKVALYLLLAIVAKTQQKMTVSNERDRSGGEPTSESKALKEMWEFVGLIRALVTMEGGE